MWRFAVLVQSVTAVSGEKLNDIELLTKLDAVARISRHCRYIAAQQSISMADSGIGWTSIVAAEASFFNILIQFWAGGDFPKAASREYPAPFPLPR